MKKYFLIILGCLLIIVGFILGLAISLYAFSGVSNNKNFDIIFLIFFWGCFVFGIYLVKKNSKRNFSFDESVNWDYSLKSIKYLGYSYNIHGVKKHFSSKYLFQWKDILEISTGIRTIHSSIAYETEILFCNKKSFKILAVKFFTSFGSLNRYASILELICNNNSTIFELSEKTKFVIEWAKHRGELKDINRRLKNKVEIDCLFQKGMIHLVELNFNEANKTFNKILKINPFNSQALIYMAEIDIDKNQDYKSAIKKIEMVINNDQNNEQALRYLMRLYSMTDSIKAEDFAFRYFKHAQTDWRSKTLFSQYLIRKEKYDEAIDVLKEIQSNIDNDFIKNSISINIDYLDKYKTDLSFRNKENFKFKLKVLWNYMVFFGGLILMILLFIWRIKSKS